MPTITLFLVAIIFVSSAYAQPFPSDFQQAAPPTAKPPSIPLTCRKALNQCLKRLNNGESCKLLPIPARSLLPQLPLGQFLLKPLRRNMWLYSDANYNSIIMLAPERLVLIDFVDSFASNTINGTGTLLTDAAERVLGDTVPKRVDMIYSHAHFDHIGAASRFYTYAKAKFPNAKFFIWGTTETRDLIKASSTNRAVLPNVIINKRGRTLRLSKDLEFTMTILGGHAQEDLMFHFPRVRRQPSILFTVDIIFPKWVMPFNLAITQDVRALVNANKAIIEKEFDILVSGHLQVGDKRDVTTNLEYLQDLLRITREAPGAVSRQTVFEAGITKLNDRREREFGNLWWSIRLFRELEIDVCYRRMIEKWGCRLAAVDVHLRGHCLIGLMFHSVDA